MRCKKCGSGFKPTRVWQEYCTTKCRQADFAAMKRQSLKGVKCVDSAGEVLVDLNASTRPSRVPLRPSGDGLRPYAWPEATEHPSHGSNPDGSTPGALQGDDYPLAYYDDGFPILPDCLRRRTPRLDVAA